MDDEKRRRRPGSRKRTSGSRKPSSRSRRTPSSSRGTPSRSSRTPSSSSERSQETQAKITSIQSKFSRLQGEAKLSGVNDTVANIEERLAEYPADLSALERRGLLHSRSIHERLDLLQEQWRKASPRLRSALRQQVSQLNNEVNKSSRKVARARGGSQVGLSGAESALDGLEREIKSAKSTLRSHYGNVDSELYGVESDLNKVKWLMDALESSPEIQLRSGEGPVKAVDTEWYRDGDEGPKGILYLTNQRLFFEQKEEVVTKKRFGLFKADSKMVQKLWLDINVSDIASVKASEKGGFLGMGKADILDLTCTGEASVSRAKFHIKGQESSDWRSLITRAKSGEIDAERYEGAEEDIPGADLTFPAECPNCLAALPEPKRGATRITCEFCGSAVGPLQE